MKFLLIILALVGFAHVSLAGSTALDVLEEMNLARTNPQRYAQIIAAQEGVNRLPVNKRAIDETVAFLQKARPLPRLSFSNGLTLAARQHVVVQGSRGGTGHGGFNHRITKFGRFSGRAGENISYGHSNARSIVVQLIIDHGVPGKAHRKNIFSERFNVAGIACGGHARYGAMCVIDFAGGYQETGAALASTRTGRQAGS